MPFGGLLTVGAISAGSNLVGGWMKSRSAKKAAEIQARIAAQVAENARQGGERTTGQLEAAGAHSEEAARNAADEQRATAANAAGEVRGAAATATGRVDQSAVDANAILQGTYNTAGQVTQPYRDAGGRAIASLENLGNEKFSFSQNDPSYQWRLTEGMKALERTRAGKGGLQ